MRNFLFTACAVSFLFVGLGCSDEETTNPVDTDAGASDGSAGASGAAGAAGAAGIGGSAGQDDGGTAGSAGSAGQADGGAGAGGAPQQAADQAGGNPSSVVIDGSFAYVAQGPRIWVWDLHTPAAPTMVSKTPYIEGMVRSLAIKGTVLYAAEQSASGLDGVVRVYDISLPLAPAPLGTVSYAASSSHNPTAVLVQGDTLFVGDTETGVHSFGLADPKIPVHKASAQSQGTTRLAYDGSRLYSMASSFSGGALYAWNVTDTSIEQASYWQVPTVSVIDFAMLDGSPVIADPSGIYVFKIVDGQPMEQLISDENATARTLARDGSRVYVPGEKGLFVFESQGGSITESSLLQVPTHRASASFASQGLVFAVTEDAWASVFEVPSAGNPNRAAHVSLPPASAQAAALVNNQLYVADFYTGLKVLDATTFSTTGRQDPPEPIDLNSMVGIEDVAVSGTTAFLADWVGVVLAVDVSNPASPQLLSATPTPGEYPCAITAKDNLVFVAECTNQSYLRILDASNPSQPLVSRGSVPVSHAVAVTEHNGLIYVADQTSDGIGGLLIVDPSDPDHPEQVGIYRQDCETASGVSLSGTTAAVTCEDSVHLVDVSNPAAPTRVARFALGTFGAQGVLIRDNRVYVGDSEGLKVIDISNPSSPALLKTQYLPRQPERIVDGGNGDVLLCSGEAGLYRVRPE